MSENNCYLCQEPKSVVGHNTQSCPSVKCKKCGQKGHIHKNCPNLNSDIDQKLEYICRKEIKSEQSIVLPDNDTKILDFVHDIKFSDDIKPILEIKKETLKSSGIDQKARMVNSIIMPNYEKINDFVNDIEFSEDIKPKFEIKEEPMNIRGVGDSVNLVELAVNRNLNTSSGLTFFTSSLPKISWAMAQEKLKSKSSGIDQKPNLVDPIMPNDKKMMDFVNGIEFSDDFKPKLEIKEETLKFKNSGLDQKPNIVDPMIPNDEKLMDFVNDIEFSDDITRFEIKEEKLKTEDNFKDDETFDSLLKEYECRKKIEMFSQFYCKLCNVQSTSQVSLSVHRAGKKHKENLKMAHPVPMPLDIKLQGNNKNEEPHSNGAELSGHGTVMKDSRLELAKSGASGLLLRSPWLRKKDFKRRKQLEKEIRNSLV